MHALRERILGLRIKVRFEAVVGSTKIQLRQI